jgi:hypothetical protein
LFFDNHGLTTASKEIHPRTKHAWLFKRDQPLSVARSKNILCQFCTDALQVSKSGFYQNYKKVIDLEESAQRCQLCRLLRQSLNDDESTMDRLLRRMGQLWEIAGAPGSEEAGKRNLHVLVDQSFHYMTTSCSAEVTCHDACDHGKTLFGIKMVLCTDKGRIYVI